MEPTASNQHTYAAVNLALATLRAAIWRANAVKITIPEAPACDLPSSPALAFEEGWRQGWLAGKVDTQ